MTDYFIEIDGAQYEIGQTPIGLIADSVPAIAAELERGGRKVVVRVGGDPAIRAGIRDVLERFIDEHPDHVEVVPWLEPIVRALDD